MQGADAAVSAADGAAAGGRTGINGRVFLKREGGGQHKGRNEA